MGTRVISSRFHFKIKRHSAGEHKLKVKRLKVCLVLQGQHMSKDRGDFTGDFSLVPYGAKSASAKRAASQGNWMILFPGRVAASHTGAPNKVRGRSA